MQLHLKNTTISHSIKLSKKHEIQFLEGKSQTKITDGRKNK